MSVARIYSGARYRFQAHVTYACIFRLHRHDQLQIKSESMGVSHGPCSCVQSLEWWGGGRPCCHISLLVPRLDLRVVTPERLFDTLSGVV